MNYWSTARRGVLGLSAATIAYSVWKKNPVLPLALYGMHLAEYFIVAKKAGKKVWYVCRPSWTRSASWKAQPYSWLPMKLEIE
jgi:hypothetical protein